MTETDIYNILDDIIEKRDNEFEEDIIITRKNRYITVPKFIEMFGESELNYDSLIDNENTTEDNDWITIFDKWKEEGLIE